jgi:hypothetical protein
VNISQGEIQVMFHTNSTLHGMWWVMRATPLVTANCFPQHLAFNFGLMLHVYHIPWFPTDYWETDLPIISFHPQLLRVGMGLEGCLSVNNRQAIRIWKTYGFHRWNELAVLTQINPESQLLRVLFSCDHSSCSNYLLISFCSTKFYAMQGCLDCSCLSNTKKTYFSGYRTANYKWISSKWAEEDTGECVLFHGGLVD